MHHAATGVGAEREAERFELLADHGCPNYRGSAKFPRCDRGTVWKDFGQVEVKGFGAEGYVVLTTAHWQLQTKMVGKGSPKSHVQCISKHLIAYWYINNLQ